MLGLWRFRHHLADRRLSDHMQSNHLGYKMVTLQQLARGPAIRGVCSLIWPPSRCLSRLGRIISLVGVLYVIRGK